MHFTQLINIGLRKKQLRLSERKKGYMYLLFLITIISMIDITLSDPIQKHGFDIYSDYCNNYPRAVGELKVLMEKPRYQHFFEVKQYNKP